MVVAIRRSALDKLRKEALDKVDGCKLTGSSDKNDLITTCGAQGPIYTEMNYIVEEIKALQTP